MSVVLIDGRSGSGKTELARAIVRAFPQFRLIQLDDLYPGWDGLQRGSADVPRLIRERSWISWDWSADRPGKSQGIDLDLPLIIEGAGSISRASVPLSDLSVWMELDDTSRKDRALARDGDTYAPHWDRWAHQEREHIAREHPEQLADFTVDGRDAALALSSLTDRLTALSRL